MNITYRNYTPALSGSLYEYMLKVYPNRKPEYLKYWIANIEKGGEQLWKKAVVAFIDDKIVGCTLCSEVTLVNNKKEYLGYFTGNTIISPKYRGMGISAPFYSLCNEYSEWITLGFTRAGENAARRYIGNYYELPPVNVYVSILPWNIIFRPNSFVFNNSFTVEKFSLFRVKSADEIKFPSGGKWTCDSFEMKRDKRFIQSRFFDIYCADRYVVYAIIGNGGEQHGYVVFRTTVYKGIRALVVVDYRHDEKVNFIVILKMAYKVANALRLCSIITMSNDSIGKIKLHPLTLNMKQLACATGMEDLAKWNKLLVTSADSDLDFVYYR